MYSEFWWWAAGLALARLQLLDTPGAGPGWAMATVTHPAVAQIYGVESWRGRPFLVVEFLAGGTLEDRLRDGPIAPAEAVSLAARLAGALEALHLCVAARPGRGGVDPDGPPVAAAGDRARLRRGAGRSLRECLAPISQFFSSGLSGSLSPYVIR